MSPFADVSDDAIRRVCGIAPDAPVHEAGLVCRSVYRWTENELAAKVSDWLATRPLRIVIIFTVALVANRLIRRAVTQLVEEMTGDSAKEARRRLRRWTPTALRSTSAQTSLRAAARSHTIALVLKSASTAAIYSIAALMALSEVGLNLAPLIAGAGIVGVAIGFGAQSLVRDFLSGLFILAEDQYGVGDVIDAGEAIGVVEAVNLRTTKLRSVEGTVWHIPNGEIRRVGNMSQQWARALLDIEVAYDTDLGLASAIVKEVADELAEADDFQHLILEEPEVWGIQELGASGIAIRLVVKTQPGEQFAVTRELRRRIKDRFDAEGIEIPFPQQVMWVRRDEGSSAEVDAVEAE